MNTQKYFSTPIDRAAHNTLLDIDFKSMNISKLKFKIMKFFWYYRMYFDKEWNTIYLMKSTSYADRIAHKQRVLDKFWHLKYFFKCNIPYWTTRKISRDYFSKSIIKN